MTTPDSASQASEDGQSVARRCGQEVATMGGLDDARAFQVLTAEQSSLMTIRTMNQAEVAGRASMFVASMSASIVAVAFVAQATRFGDETVAFALLLLPVTLFLGLTTFVRAVDLAAEEVRWIAALNHVRSAYVRAIPELAQYFATFRPETRLAVVATLSPARESVSSVYGLATTPGVIAVLNAALGGAIVGVVVVSSTAVLGLALLIAAAAFFLVLAAQAAWGTRLYGRVINKIA